MIEPRRPPRPLDPEKVAYWYFRLNGFLQIENFVVHPPGRGGQRTDADLLAVRFPYRAERLFDDPNDIMKDDVKGLALSPNEIDVAIVEVKTNQPCTLNGPWTDPNRQNLERVIAALGCVSADRVSIAAKNIYECGSHSEGPGLRLRLIAVGRDENPALLNAFPAVTQATWVKLLGFIWQRLDHYRKQKAQVDQWDSEGRRLKDLAENCLDATRFAASAMELMGVRPAAVERGK